MNHVEHRRRIAEGYEDPAHQAEDRKNERKVVLWLLAILVAAIIVGFLIGRASADELPTFPVYKVGKVVDEMYASACLDVATAQRIIELQQTDGIEAARKMFVDSHVCWADYMQFVPIQMVVSYPMVSKDGQLYSLSVMEVASARSPEAPHIFVLTEGSLVDEPDT